LGEDEAVGDPVYPYEEEGGGSPPLRRLVHVVRRRWITVLVVMVLAMGATFAYGLTREQSYRATSEILVRGTSAASQPGANLPLSANPERLMETELELLESRSTRTEVADESGESIAVSAEALGDSDVIQVTLEGDDPEVVAQQLTTFTNTYLALRRQDEVEALRTEMTAKRATRRSANQELQRARAPLERLDERLLTLPPGDERDALQQERDAVALEIETRTGSLQSYVTSLDDELRQLQGDIAAAGGGLAAISIPDSASPVNPSPIGNLVVGGLIGLLAGIGAAFIKEQFDDSIRTVHDLERVLEGCPVIGVIPARPQRRDGRREGLVVANEPTAPAAEAYRNLATTVAFAIRRDDVQIIEVTSPVAGEGKTTTVANLGLALARTGQRVLIVDADFRRQRLNRVFGVQPSERGLATALTGEDDPLDVILSLDTDMAGDTRTLGLLPAGSTPAGPVELLESAETPKVLERLREEASIILIDTPPVLPVADALVLAQHVDRTVLVCAAGSTGRQRLDQAAAALRSVEAELLGAILNKVTWEAGYGNYEYYSESKRRDRG
jgi:tyrosine-protein kinase